MSLTVLTGPPGAGKSTLAELAAAASDRSVLVPGDRFLGFMRQGFIAPWLDGSEPQNKAAWEASLRATSAYLEAGYDVVYDGIVYPDSLDRVMALAGRHTISFVVLLPPLELCLARIREREGHGFRDADVTRRMYERFRASTLGSRHIVDQAHDRDRIVTDIVSGRYLVSADG